MKNNKDLLLKIQETLSKETSLEKDLPGLYVLVNDGAVILGGSVENGQSRKLARQLVRSVSGVEQLIDDLKIQPAQRERIGVQIDWVSGHVALV